MIKRLQLYQPFNSIYTMKKVKRITNHIYDTLILQIIQDINETYENKVVSFIVNTWVLSLMFLAIFGILFMMFMITTNQL